METKEETTMSTEENQKGAWQLAIKGNIWKLAVIGLALTIVVICIIFAIPFNKVTVEVVETYTETEYKQEAYTELESYTVEATEEATERRAETLYDATLIQLGRRVIPDRWGTEVEFDIDVENRLNPVVRGSWKVEDFSNAVYVTITDPDLSLVYTYLGSQGALQSGYFEFVPKRSGMYLVRFSSDYVRINKYARLTVVLKWDETVTGTSKRTETREVTKYRQVPVEVEKQRTVMKYKKVSTWELIFGIGIGNEQAN